MEHCLAAEKFANRRSHNCVAITPPGVGRGTGTFELQRLMAVVWGEDFAESNRSTVAELAGPVPKLAVIRLPVKSCANSWDWACSSLMSSISATSGEYITNSGADAAVGVTRLKHAPLT